MIAKKCDRCGNLYELKYYPEMFGSGNIRSDCIEVFSRNKFGDKKKGKEYDICPDCAMALKMWLKNNRKNQPTNTVQDGKWEFTGTYRCSLCMCDAFKGLDGSPILSSYCPNCGAWMDGENK